MCLSLFEAVLKPLPGKLKVYDCGAMNPMVVSLGREVVVDPKICHGMSWDAIVEEWNGNITKLAIAEAVSLASRALLNHVDEFALKPASA
jgi:hypothetical protein